MNKSFQDVLTLAQAGKTDQALERCSKLIKKKPRDATYLLLAASIHAGTGNYPEVIHYCGLALKLEPKNSSALYNISVAALKTANFNLAVKHGRNLASTEPRHARGLSNLGLAYWHLGEFEKAVKVIEKAINVEPDLATAHNNLGLAYKSLNRIEEASRHFQNAIRIDPQLADAYFNYALILIEKGDDYGNELLEKALKINPNHAELHNYTGKRLLDEDKASEAIEHFKIAITHDSHNINAYLGFGKAQLINENYDAAETTFRKVLELQPDNAFACNGLGQALVKKDNFQLNYSEAEKYFKQALSINPELHETYIHLANSYAEQGLTDKALEHFQTFHQKVPDDDTVISSMISALERKGDFERAENLLKEHWKENSDNPNIKLAYGRLAKHMKKESKAIDVLLTIDDKESKKRLLIEKYHLLGKLSQSLKDIDNTFLYYKKANDLEDEEFNIEESQKQFDRTKLYFTKKKIKTLNKADNDSTLPIFIFGMPRSGTTLTEQILSSHPDVYGAGELMHIGQIKSILNKELTPKNTYPNSLDNLTTKHASEIAKKHIEDLQNMAPDAKHVVDKMPHNFFSLGLISTLFPQATFIHCQRSPVDICLSIYFQHFNKQHAYSNDLAMLGKYYRQYADLMNHWNDVLDINIIPFKYENVILNPEEETRKLLEQCNLSWNDNCLNFHNNKRVVMTPSYDQVRQPLYTSSVAKWKKYEHHLDDLLESLGEYAY